MRTERDAILSVQRFMAGVLAEPWDIRTDVEAGAPPLRPFVLVEQSGPAVTTGPPAAQDVALPVTVNLFPVKQDTAEAAADAALDLREQVWQAVKWGPDPRRPTTDRLPLYAYQPRVETHRFKLPWWLADEPFAVRVAGVTTDWIEPTAVAAEVAGAIDLALSDAGICQLGDVTGQDRGTRLWDVFYGGSIAGQSLGDPMMVTAGDSVQLWASLRSDPLFVGDQMLTVGEVPAQAGAARMLLQGAPSPWRGPSDFMRVDSFSQNTIPDPADPTLVMVAADLRLTFTRGLPLPSDVRILQRVRAISGPGG